MTETIILYTSYAVLITGGLTVIYICAIILAGLINLLWMLSLHLRAMYRTEKVWREALKLYIEKHAGMKLERNDLKEE